MLLIIHDGYFNPVGLTLTVSTVANKLFIVVLNLACVRTSAAKFSCKRAGSCNTGMAAVSEDRPSECDGKCTAPSHGQLQGDDIQAPHTPTDSIPGK